MRVVLAVLSQPMNFKSGVELVLFFIQATQSSQESKWSRTNEAYSSLLRKIWEVGDVVLALQEQDRQHQRWHYRLSSAQRSQVLSFEEAPSEAQPTSRRCYHYGGVVYQALIEVVRALWQRRCC